jgi:hypothetical protein
VTGVEARAGSAAETAITGISMKAAPTENHRALIPPGSLPRGALAQLGRLANQLNPRPFDRQEPATAARFQTSGVAYFRLAQASPLR